MNPIPQVHPVCNSKELPELSWESAGMPPDFHTTLTTTSTAGTTRGATEEELEALTAYNWSRGQSAHRLACLRLKKQNNKNKNHPNTQCCKQPYGSTSDDQYCKSWTVGKIQTPFSLPGRGPARWVTFPGERGGMPFWQVSPSTHFLSPPPTGLQPERGHRGEMTDSKAILQCRKKNVFGFFSFFFFKISAYKYG